MAAGANASSGGHSDACNGSDNVGECNCGGREIGNGTGGVLLENPEEGRTKVSLRHNPGLSLGWRHEEQSILEELLAKHASESTSICYAKIAQALSGKTVRDVALRCRWMSKNVNGKRRKDENNSKIKNKKEKVTDLLPKSSEVANRSNGPPYVQSMMAMDGYDGILLKAIDGVTGKILKQNAQTLDQISYNFSTFMIHENIDLFCQARNNIVSLLNDLSDMPEIMKQMPPLPVKLNDELANSILPKKP